MTIPALTLLGFAAWTIVVLLGGVGVYRWRRILTGRTPIAEWRADLKQGDEWYQRAMRAHMNCVENLPLLCAVVIALAASGARGPAIDALALATLGARMCQSLVHLALPQTNAVVSLRFGFYCVQLACITVLGSIAGTVLMAR